MGKQFLLPIKILGDPSGGVRAVKSVTRSMKNLTKAQTTANRNMAHSTSLMQGYGTAIAGISFGVVTKGIIEAGFAFDSFNTLLSQSQIDHLIELSDDLGISLQGSARSFSLLNAAASGTILEGEGVEEIFDSMAVASRAFNLSAEDMRGLLRAVEQMMNKGTVQAEELRGQLSERLPGAFRLTAEAMGITTQELSKMLENGDVIATEMLPKLAKSLRENYGEAAETMSGKGAAAVERFRNQIFLLGAAISENGVGEHFTDIVTDVTDGIRVLQDNTDLLVGSFGALALLLTGRMANAKAADIAATIQSTRAKAAETLAIRQNAIDTRLAAVASLQTARATQAEAAAELLNAKQKHMSSLAAKGSAASTNALLAARVNLTRANKALAISEAGLAGATAAVAASTSRFKLIAGGLLSLIGGWPTIILGTAAGMYFLAKSLKGYSDETKEAIEHAREFALQVNEQGDATPKAQLALLGLKDRLAELKAEYAATSEEERNFAKDKGTLFGVKTLTEEITHLERTIASLEPSARAAEAALTRFENKSNDWIAYNKAYEQSLLAVHEATSAAIEMIMDEGAALSMTAEEKFKYTLTNKVLAKHTEANEAALKMWVDRVWEEQQALKASAAEMKAREKNVKDMTSAIQKAREKAKEFSQDLQAEVTHLRNVVNLGEDRADQLKEIAETKAASNDATREGNLALLAEKHRLEGVIEKNKEASKTTEDLTGWIEAEADAYDELFAAANQAEVDAYDIQILEAQAQGHMDVAEALEVEKRALELYYAQQGDSVERTYDQILADEQYRAELRKKADEFKAVADEEARAWENMTKRVQEAWGDLIYGYMEQALMDGEFSFAEFRDNIWRMFIRLIADMIAKWATTQIFGAIAGGGNIFSSIITGANTASTAISAFSGNAGTATASITGLGTAAKYVGGYVKGLGGGFKVAAAGARESTIALEAFGGAGAEVGVAASEAAVSLEAFGGAGAKVSTATSGLTPAMAGLGFAAVGVGLAMAFSSKKAKGLAEVAEEVQTKFQSASDVVNTATLTWGTYGDEGLIALNKVQGGAQLFRDTMMAADVSVRQGADGMAILGDNTESTRQMALAYNDAVAAGLQTQIDLMIQKQGLNEQDNSDRQAILDIEKQITAEWQASLDLINGTDFDGVVQEFVDLGIAGETAFRNISADGVITTQEIKANFGDAAAAIITQMEGASAISVTALLKILGISGTTADGIAGDFESATGAAVASWKSGTDEIQSAINSLEGTSVTSTHDIYVRRHGQGGEEGGDSFASGTGGWRTVPYDGYQPTLHKGEGFNVVPARSFNDQAKPANVGGMGDERIVKLLVGLNATMNEMLGYSEDTARSAQRTSLKRTSRAHN